MTTPEGQQFYRAMMTVTSGTRVDVEVGRRNDGQVWIAAGIHNSHDGVFTHLTQYQAMELAQSLLGAALGSDYEVGNQVSPNLHPAALESGWDR